jgi:hypothetical protein
LSCHTVAASVGSCRGCLVTLLYAEHSSNALLVLGTEFIHIRNDRRSVASRQRVIVAVVIRLCFLRLSWIGGFRETGEIR